MFFGTRIEDLVSLLRRRSAFLYHATQLKDFDGYVAEKAILSHAAFEASRQVWTPFDTDGRDRRNGVWDKVFLNLSDFGRSFAGGGSCVPNPFGPILLKINPEALLNAVDVAVCLRSAASKGFVRERESLRTIDEVDRVFLKDAGHQGSDWVKYRGALREEFGPSAVTVEISVTLDQDRLSLDHVHSVVVDPYVFDGIPLRDIVAELVEPTGLKVYRRSVRQSGTLAIYEAFLAAATEDEFPAPEVLARQSGQIDVRSWARRMASRSSILEKNYYRFLSYLRQGTIEPVKRGSFASDFASRRTARSKQMEEAVWDEPSWYEPDDYGEEWEIAFTPDWDRMYADLADDQTDWSRSTEEGWFYSDEDPVEPCDPWT